MSDSTLNNDIASNEDALKTFALAKDATNESEDAYANDTTEDSTNVQSIVSNAPRHGFERLDKSIMPFGGKQYPSNIEFDVRAANTAEIRHWSSLDDTANPRILLDYFNDIIDKCVKVLNGSTTDIKEADRLISVSFFLCKKDCDLITAFLHIEDLLLDIHNFYIFFWFFQFRNIYIEYTILIFAFDIFNITVLRYFKSSYK